MEEIGCGEEGLVKEEEKDRVEHRGGHEWWLELDWTLGFLIFLVDTFYFVFRVQVLDFLEVIDRERTN